LIHPDIWWRHQRDGACAADGVDGVLSHNRPVALTRVDGSVVGGVEMLQGRSVFLLAGIARPRDFVALVRGQRAEVVGQRFVRDHHRLGVRDIELARRSGALLLCTEKDAVKLAGAAPALVSDLLVLCVEPRIVRGEVLLSDRLRSLFG
jgi:tetraacyldisaccharide-1-P 4'-kinase